MHSTFRPDRHLLAAATLVASVLVCGAAAGAQRTFVASNGVDTNVCSILSPCRGFARAITQTAAGGEIIVLDSAGYGIVTIDKSVSIIAPAGVYAGISVFAAQDGITIATPSIAVVLRGLNINGQGGNKGVAVNAPTVTLHLESIVIAGMGSTGVSMLSGGGSLLVRDSMVRGNGAGGLVVAGARGGIDRTRIENNAGTGLELQLEAWVTVSDSSVTQNGSHGIEADDSGPTGTYTQLSVQGSTVTDNGGDGIKLTVVLARTVVASVTRSVVARNFSNGVNALATDTGFVYVTLDADTIEGNAQTGILAGCGLSNAGHVKLIASGNTVSRNSVGINVTFGDAHSLSNNLVYSNVADIIGAAFMTFGPAI